MSTVTYITDTNADPYSRYLIVDGQRETAEEWFETALPGDEVADFREALITAATRLAGEDRELLASNGFTVAELPLAYTEADDARVFGEYNVSDWGRDGIYNAIDAECEAWGLTDGYSTIWETLTVLEEIGGNVERFLD
mgnify:FL=1